MKSEAVVWVSSGLLSDMKNKSHLTGVFFEALGKFSDPEGVG